MQCSQFFFNQKPHNTSSQNRQVAAHFDFIDVPDAPVAPVGSDLLGGLTDSLREYQPSQVFKSAPQRPLLSDISHQPVEKSLCTEDAFKRKHSVQPSFNNLEQLEGYPAVKVRKLNEEGGQMYRLDSSPELFRKPEDVEIQKDLEYDQHQQIGHVKGLSQNLIKVTEELSSSQVGKNRPYYRGRCDELYTPAPLVLPRQNAVGIKLRSVEELPDNYRSIFNFPYFNIVQSRVFQDVLYTDKPLVVCAPTGSGKTVVFELGIIRLLMKMDINTARNFKVVYMAPIKALCSERYQDWQTKFEGFGLKCMELTGDTDIQDYYELQQVNIIFTTPEKWDSMTRRWRDNSLVVQSVCLFLIDEIHVLHDSTRGATVEAVISRMKTIQASIGKSSTELTLPKLRFIAVSATIPNIEDIAEWLGDNKTKATFFKMDDDLRPVRLRKVVLGFPFDEQKGSDFHFDMSLSYKLSGIINTYSENKPCLVFCSTRKSTQQAADILCRDSRGSYARSSEIRQTLQKYSNMIKDSKLRDTLLKGVGFHHAGMDLQDRKMMEELFSTGHLQVLVATSTLAMGVNLPAHLVILKSTQHYNMGAIEEYSDTQVLQMIGRAGRPQFDTSATAVIMTKIKNKMKYESLLNGTQMIESSLHKHLIEHVNAEIVLHTINDLSIAMEWIRYTFLYIRVMKNPKHYSMPLGLNQEQIETRLQDLCMRNLNQLANIQLINMDGETFDVKPTESGKLMARYCIAFETMKKFCALSSTESIEDLVKTISESEEFTDIQLRVNEKKTLNTLNKDKNRATVRYPMQGKIKTKQMKVNCLIQAQLGSLLVQDFSLQQDTTRIFRAAQRLSRCLVELLWTKQDYTSFLHAVQFCKCIKAKLWEESRHIAKQLDGIGPTLSNALANAGITSFQKIEETNPRELELIVNRHPPFGNQVRDAVSCLPKYELTIEQVSQYSHIRAEVIVHLNIANQEKLEKQKSEALNHTCVLLVGDQDNRIIFRRRIMDSCLLRDNGFTKKLEIHKANMGPDLYINFISQDWVGLDVQSTYTPFYLGAKKISNSLSTHSQVPRSCENQRRQDSSSIQTDSVIPQGCNHRCVNKSLCGHKCCNIGTTVSRRTGRTSTTAPRSSGNTIGNYVSTLKDKLSLMIPRSTMKTVMTPKVYSKPSLNIERFAYTPRTPVCHHKNSSSEPQDSDWAHLSMYQKNRQVLMEEQEKFHQEEDLPDIDEHSPSPRNIRTLNSSPINHQPRSVRYSHDDQHVIDVEQSIKPQQTNSRVSRNGFNFTPISWKQSQMYRESEDYISRPHYQRRLFKDSKDTQRFKPRQSLSVDGLYDTDDTEAFQYRIADGVGYKPVYAVYRDPSAVSYNSPRTPLYVNPSSSLHSSPIDMVYRDRSSLSGNHSDVEIPELRHTGVENQKVHRYGQVVAWSNSQKKSQSSDGDWSGSDNDLVSAEIPLLLDGLDGQAAKETDKKTECSVPTEINDAERTEKTSKSEKPAAKTFVWSARDFFSSENISVDDSAGKTFSSIFDGIF